MMNLKIWREGDGFNTESKVKDSLEKIILQLEDT